MEAIKYTKAERALILLVAHKGLSFSGLFAKFPNYEEQLDDLIASMLSKLQTPGYEEVWHRLTQWHEIREEKSRLAQSQRYEEAAKLRDRERKFAVEHFGFDPADYREEDGSQLEEELANMDKMISETSRLALFITPGTATPQEIGTLLHELSKLYMMLGGSGISFKPDEILLLKEELA